MVHEGDLFGGSTRRRDQVLGHDLATQVEINQRASASGLEEGVVHQLSLQPDESVVLDGIKPQQRQNAKACFIACSLACAQASTGMSQDSLTPLEPELVETLQQSGGMNDNGVITHDITSFASLFGGRLGISFEEFPAKDETPLAAYDIGYRIPGFIRQKRPLMILLQGAEGLGTWKIIGGVRKDSAGVTLWRIVGTVHDQDEQEFSNEQLAEAVILAPHGRPTQLIATDPAQKLNRVSIDKIFRVKGRNSSAR